MKKQAEKIEITDDIIKNKFDEILSGKDIEVQQIMGFNNIDEIKRYEFLRENFVKEVKSLINNLSYSSNPLKVAYKVAYNFTGKMAKDPIPVIYSAIADNDIDLVEALLTSLRVDPNTEFNQYPTNTFLEAALSRNKEMVKCLLKKGADPIFGFYKMIKESKAAAEMGFDNIEDYSKAKAAINDNLIPEEEKSTLNAKIKKHEFLRESFITKFKVFIEDPNKNTCDAYYKVYCDIATITNNPEYFTVKAIQQGDYDLVNTLLTAFSIAPNKVAYVLSDSGCLLYFACINHQKEIAELLIKKGADVNFSDNYYKPPLYSAIEAGHLDMVAFLLENGANPNYMGNQIFSCLEEATFRNQDIAIVTKLLAYGANMEFKSSTKTVFETLTSLSSSDQGQDKQNKMMKVFLQYGANPEGLDPDCQRFYDMEIMYKPLRALLTLESAFRRNDYTAIKDIDKKDLAEFIQWKSEIWPVKNVSKNEYIKNLSELITFSKQVQLDSDDSIKQPLIKLKEKIDKLAPSLKFQCLVKTADIIKGDVEGTITFDNELKYNTIMDLLEKNGFQVDVTGKIEEHAA
ncbi:hypothetical protein H6P87_00291 [Rickettsia tillamookensis]|uniref:Ankyrin repeat protein n=1 Tax=Rickettsia tillamookensis TaxID=2761623 RepID=A0A9E6MH01_9RICK|nr:ankyrin repeat domain-containing protein [Rickettsia tillamookensis]QQV74751.1 hypothetical protein H6P87_00291 [Rickettsia tillamookensis]